MVFEFGDFVFDESAYELRRGDTPLKVDPKVLDLLAYMVRRPGQLVTREELISEVWEGRALSQSVLSGAIWSLRQALGSLGKGKDGYVATVYGRGYRFTATVSERAAPSAASVQASEPTPTPMPALTQAVAAVPVAAPLVGRAAPLTRARELIRQAAGGRGRILAVTGEPGIGKTHFAEIVAEEAARNGLGVAWGHCRPLTSVPPFWPFIQLLRAATRLSPSPAVEEALRSVLPELPVTGEALDAVWKEGAMVSTYQIFDGFARALYALTHERPWALILDDLQWADTASLRLLAYLAPEIAHLRLLVVVTARSTGATTGDTPLGAALGHRNCELIGLSRLSEADVLEYVEMSLGRLGESVGRAVYQKSEGNPFFMVELVRPFTHGQPVNVEQLSLSGPALDIVRQRLSSFGKETLEVLAAGAIVGRSFDLGLLSAATERDSQQLMELLDSPCALGVIARVPDKVGHFRFGHDLIRGVLLEDLPQSEQPTIHHRVAAAMEQRHPVLQGVPSPELVHHLLSALPHGDLAKAVDYALRVAQRSTLLCAHVDAADLLRKALAGMDLVLDANARLRCDVLVALVRSERLSADPQAAEHLAQAVAQAEEHGFADILAEAGQRLSPFPGYMMHRNARYVLESAQRLLPEGDYADRARVAAHLSWTAPNCFIAKRAQALVEEADRLAQCAGGLDPRAIALSRGIESQAIALFARLHLACGPGDHTQAEQVAERYELLLRDASSMGQEYWRIQVNNARIVMALQCGDLAAADREVEGYGRRSRTLRLPELTWHYYRYQLIQRFNRGELVEDQLAELQTRARNMGLVGGRGVSAVDRLAIGLLTGRKAGLAGYENRLAFYEADCPNRKAFKIRVLAFLGASSRVRTALQDFFPPSTLADLPHDRDYLATIAHLAVASVECDSAEHVRALMPLLKRYQHRFVTDLTIHCEGSVEHFWALLARHQGLQDEAAAAYRRAFEANERAGLKGRAALSLDALGQLLMESSDAKQRAQGEELACQALEQRTALGYVTVQSTPSDRLGGAAAQASGG